MQFLKSLILLFGFFTGLQLLASPPVPFSGKLAVDGTNFHGNALFSFSIVDQEGTEHWRHTEEQDSTIEIFVLNGRYVALLGGQGMLPLPADLFLKEKSLSLRVSVDLQDGQGMRLLSPDQQITSTPYALAAELAQLAERATIADAVKTGSITASMLQPALLEDLNRTTELGEITRDMLPQDVRNDLNATITRDRLSADVRADLNRTVRLQDLSPEVSQSINRTISLSDLDSQVITELNNSISPGSISLDQLSQQVRDDINATISRDRLSQNVRDELNATITRDRLSGDLLADLNRTVRLQDLSPEVSQSINRSITLSDLDSQVIAELNNSIAPGSISLDQLSQQVRDDINRTITKSMLSQEVLDELNASGGSTGSMPGSLIAVPANQSAPSGYELYQMGDRKNLVWEEKAPVSVARYVGDSVVVLDGEMYVVGGWDGDGNFTLLEKYNPLADTWSTLSPMPMGRVNFACAALNGKIYAIGGVDSSTVDVYDSNNDTWSTGTPLPSVVSSGTAISLNGKIYLISKASNSLLCFDPETDQWLAKANMPTPRGCAKVVYYKDRIWAIGGSDGSQSTNTVESYNPAENSWQSEATLSIARQWASAWVANGRIYVTDGGSSNVESYNPLSQTWSTGAALPEGRGSFAADTAVTNNHVYIVAGNSSDQFYNKVFAADLNASVEGVYDLYVKTGDASTGTPTVQAEVADGSIGPSKLSSEVSNALKPVVIGQPSSVVEVGGATAYLSVGATGGDNTYQWKKNGVDITGATSSTLSITDLNASQHEGNYTVVVSNAFGSATSSVAQIDVNGSLTEGLVGWWKFDETEGNIASDSSGNGNDGTLTNGPTWTEGKIGGALSFDGVDDFVNLGNKSEITLIHNKTFSMWLRPASFDARRNPYNKAYGGTGTFTLEVNQRLNYFYGTSGSDATPYTGYSTSVGAFSLNNWTLVTLVRDLSSLKIIYYLDGILDKEMTAHYSVAVAGSESAYIGKGYESNFHGLLDDIRIYDRAVSAVEVKALYELGDEPVQESGTGTTTVVNGTVADGSIGPSKLSSEVSNALKPVVIGQPSSVVGVSGTSAYLKVEATGGDNTYQWKKNGVDITGATNGTLSISDLNASQHEGNYTVVISNTFGSVTSSVAQIDVNGSLTEGLVGWWKFDETEGNIASDSSGNGNDGTLTNGPTWTEGKFGGALNFDGENDLLKLPSTILNGITDFSASFHFLENLNNTDHHHFISVANASTANRFILGLESNYEFNINDSITGASLLNYQSTHNFINWSPIAVSRNSSTTKLFISGILVSYASHSGDSLTISENGLWVGGDQDSVGGGWGATQQLNGSIDDLRIYDRALTAFEIKSLHELGEQPVQESGSGTTTVVNGTVADGSITTNQLSEQILKYLKPEITQQPTTAGTIFADTNHTFSVSAEGKYLTYQWKKNGVNLTGETNATLIITDANATQHEGNYSVVVSNDFGSVESGEFEIQISDAITNGLVGWWKFDETDGTIAYDSSGNGNNGNLTNGPTWVTGKIGGALSFDGVDDLVLIGGSSDFDLQELSISAWVLSENYSEAGFIFEKTTDGTVNSQYGFFFENGLRLRTKGGTDVYFSISDTGWQLVTSTYDGSKKKLFTNGVLRSQVDWVGTMPTASTGVSSIGGFSQNTHENWSHYIFNGLIDDVRVYDRAMSATEVQALFQLGQ